jgi:hypothetical protein
MQNPGINKRLATLKRRPSKTLPEMRRLQRLWESSEFGVKK